MFKARLLALLSLALVPPGCTAAVAGSGAAMVDTQWRLTAIDGEAPERPDGAQLTFEQTRFSASAGCNSIGGDYRLEGGRMISSSVVATQMYCDGKIWNQELAVNALLAGAPQIDRQGQRLRLASAGHSLEAVALAR
jgi:heat shock protein HslJ